MPPKTATSSRLQYSEDGTAIRPLYDPGKRFKLQLGVPNRLLSHLYPNRTFRVSDVFVHPEYEGLDRPAVPHDLALLKLTGPVELVRGVVAPICLPFGRRFPDTRSGLKDSDLSQIDPKVYL